MGGGTVWFAAAGGVRLSCTRDGETTGVPTGVGRRWKSPPTGDCSERGRRGGRQERSAAAGGAGRRRRGSVLKMPADGQHEWSTVLERGEGGKGRDASRGEARVLGCGRRSRNGQPCNKRPCNLATRLCSHGGGAPRGPWSLPSFVNEPPATLHLDRSRVDDGGEGCSTNVSEIFKRQIRLLVRDGYPCWTWTEHDTPQHTAAVALSPLAVPSRVEVSGYIGERVGVCLSRWLRGRDLSLRSNRTSG